jgi:cyanophycin synthetase
VPRVIEIRLLDGPNIYRLEPTLKIEVAVGRRRTWYGQRLPGRHAVVRLGRPVRPADAPRVIREMVSWVRRLHRTALGRTVPVTIHRSSDPGHWIVAYPWTLSDQAETIARAALRLADESTERMFERARRRVAEAGGVAPEWITDEQRSIRLISVSGTNGKSTTVRMITHICRAAGLRVGTTTTDGVLVDEQMVEEGDYSGPAGARAVLAQPGLDVGVLETARGGILLRGLGYESNDASVLTNISADHLDLQGVHTLPELAEVKSVINRVTRRDGAVVLNADDPLVAGVARHVSAPVFWFTLRGRAGPRLRQHLERGGTVFALEDGQLVERVGQRRHAIVPVAEVPATLFGLARHNVANALAATAGARALGISRRDAAAGLRDFSATADLMPGRLNLYVRGSLLAMVDYAHNEAGLEAVVETAERLIGPRGRRQAVLTVVIGTAGDRPDDSLRAIGALAGEHADRVAIKESLTFLRGRTRAGVIGELLAGAKTAGATAANVPVYVDELTALQTEIAPDSSVPHVLLLMCQEQRPEVRAWLEGHGFDAVVSAGQIEQFRPR